MIDYLEEELHKLIALSIFLDLYTFYIVDSLGNMKVDSLKKMYATIICRYTKRYRESKKKDKSTYIQVGRNALNYS